MSRTIVITGAASGIGRATAELVEASGDRVIGADLRDAEILADLGTAAGREVLLREVARLAPAGIDGVVAAAGIATPEKPRETIAINYFGAVATLEGLRPLLAKSHMPRAVAVASTTVFLPRDDAVVEMCLSGSESLALSAISDRPESSYSTSKHALARWVRRTAIKREWAGSRILLNAIAPGVTLTPMHAATAQVPGMEAIVAQTNPIAVSDYAEPGEMAELIQYLLNFRGKSLVGQIIYNDGGTDAIVRTDLV